MSKATLSFSLQEKILSLLLFNDQQCCTLRDLVPLDCYEGNYYEIARRTYRFIGEHKKAPQDHIYDLLSDILEGEDINRREIYEETLRGLFSVQVDEDFTLKSVKKFLRIQKMKQAVLKAADIISKEHQIENVDEQVDVIFTEAVKDQGKLFDGGTRLTDLSKSLKFLQDRQESFRTGISFLDKRGIGPVRKQLHLFIAQKGAGKSTFLLELGRNSLLDGHKVCHITLEMSEELTTKRYIANLFGITKRKEEISLTKLIKDDDHKLCDITVEKILAKVSFEDSHIEQTLIDKIQAFGHRLSGLDIKEFPTSQLTIPNLRAYLDLLESTQHFVPDLLLVDYADIMHVDSDNYRIALGEIYKELRGIAVERNIAVVTASQSNREGAKAKKVNATHIAEDWSKAATADTILTMSQSEMEQELGLARLYIDKAREDHGGATLLISTNYHMNQFCRDWVLMDKSAQNVLEETHDA